MIGAEGPPWAAPKHGPPPRWAPHLYAAPAECRDPAAAAAAAAAPLLALALGPPRPDTHRPRPSPPAPAAAAAEPAAASFLAALAAAAAAAPAAAPAAAAPARAARFPAAAVPARAAFSPTAAAAAAPFEHYAGDVYVQSIPRANGGNGNHTRDQMFSRFAAPPPGRALSLEPMKPALKSPGSVQLKLRYDEMLSDDAFNLSLRRCTQAARGGRSPTATRKATSPETSRLSSCAPR
jgi:hypothetical protein